MLLFTNTLFDACRQGNWIALLMLQTGNVKDILCSVDSKGYTLLMYACKSLMIEVIEFLIKRPCLIEHVAPDGKSAIGLAIESFNLYAPLTCKPLGERHETESEIAQMNRDNMLSLIEDMVSIIELRRINRTLKNACKAKKEIIGNNVKCPECGFDGTLLQIKNIDVNAEFMEIPMLAKDNENATAELERLTSIIDYRPKCAHCGCEGGESFKKVLKDVKKELKDGFDDREVDVARTASAT